MDSNTLKETSDLARLYIIKYLTKFLDFCKKKSELATFYSFDEIHKNCWNCKSILIG